MSDCFSFALSNNENARSNLVIFFAAAPASDEIVSTIKDKTNQVFLPRFVYIIVREKYQNKLTNIADDKNFINEVSNHLDDASDKLVGVSVSEKGIFKLITDNVVEASTSLDHILATGMLEIFKTRKGLISSSPNYHFSKPSGDHCDKFIRASNLLVSTTEVTFLALSLLPYINGGLKRIYIDTSSIAYLVSTALRLSEETRDAEIMIDSFESYTAVKEDYDFIEGPKSLIVISATTSGSLAKQFLTKHSFIDTQVITFLYIGSIDNQIGLLDISPVVPEGITSTPEPKCRLCKNGSRVIRISGDQFLPETPQNELLVIRKTNFSSERKELFGEFATKKLLLWNRKPPDSDTSVEHFYIDVAKVLCTEGSKFKKDLDRATNRYLSRHVNTVIPVDEGGSQNMAKKIVGDHKCIKLIPLSELSMSNLEHIKSVLVVAGAITSGRRLLTASRKLREIGNDATITYLIGFSKIPTSAAFTQLKKDLEMGGHEVFVLRFFPMPRINEHIRTSWNVEQNFLYKQSGKDPFMPFSGELPEALSSRLDGLVSLSLDSKSLFLKDPCGEALRLRKKFAFWSGLDIADSVEESWQSDVYWTIQSILHDLRSMKEDKGLATIYHTTLISPVCFDRYNDGVIQACILRSALPVELNYSIDENYSRQMADVVCSVLNGWETEQGEASLEFLLALACGRLTLNKEHLQKKVLECYQDKMPPEMKFFFDYIKKAAAHK